MVLIHIPRACATITADFVKKFFQEFSLVEYVNRSDNGYEAEVQFHVHVKEWNDALQIIFQSTGTARLCYEDEGSRPSYFICYLQ